MLPGGRRKRCGRIAIQPVTNAQSVTRALINAANGSAGVWSIASVHDHRWGRFVCQFKRSLIRYLPGIAHRVGAAIQFEHGIRRDKLVRALAVQLSANELPGSVDGVFRSVGHVLFVKASIPFHHVPRRRLHCAGRREFLGALGAQLGEFARAREEHPFK